MLKVVMYRKEQIPLCSIEFNGKKELKSREKKKVHKYGRLDSGRAFSQQRKSHVMLAMLNLNRFSEKIKAISGRVSCASINCYLCAKSYRTRIHIFWKLSDVLKVTLF